jgi:hypothetical protein
MFLSGVALHIINLKCSNLLGGHFSDCMKHHCALNPDRPAVSVYLCEKSERHKMCMKMSISKSGMTSPVLNLLILLSWLLILFLRKNVKMFCI